MEDIKSNVVYAKCVRFFYSASRCDGKLVFEYTAN